MHYEVDNDCVCVAHARACVRRQVEEDERPPRLYQCTYLSSFTVNEIVEFTQQDLVTDDVFLLDAYDTIYIWIGDDSRQEEKDMCQDFAFVSARRRLRGF